MPQKEKIRSMFDAISGDYDRLNHIMSLGVDRLWRRRAVKEIRGAARGNEPRVLDIACGTGDFAITIARSLPGSTVTAVDISYGMLSVMAGKVASEGLQKRISMEIGDCASMRFDDGAFDVATIAFGIRNFEDRPAALREIHRVLKPGGRLVILELSVPRCRPVRWAYLLYFKHILPLIGGWISGDTVAYRYLPASVLAFPGPEQWMQTMRDAGFGDVKHRALSLGLCRMYVGCKAS